MRVRPPQILLVASALVVGHGCGGRSSLELSPSSNDEPSTATGEAAPASGGTTAAGGRSTGGSGAGGGPTNNTGGAPTGGASAVGGMAGGPGGSGGSGAGGDMMNMGGAGAEAICDDPAFACTNARSAWLMFSQWNMKVTDPQLARCIDYNDDEWVDYLDYLSLTEHWLEGCPPIGPLQPPGECLFYGDVNHNRCLDMEDYELIQAQRGLTGAAASSCSDVSQDGLIDVLDLGYLLYMMDSAGCPDEELDPTLLIDGYSGVAQSCDGASPGDINQDGEVNVLDLSGVLAVLELQPTDVNRCMDVDRNGAIDLADALQVLHRYAPMMKAATCQDTLDELEAAVEGAKACSSDADCQIVDAECSHLSEHCSRVVYLNQSIDPYAFYLLARDVTECINGGNPCRSCAEPPPAAICELGSCQGAE